MILGQAAGVAAALAIHGNTPVQGIAVATLVEKLKAQGVIMEYEPSAQARAIQLFHQRK